MGVIVIRCEVESVIGTRYPSNEEPGRVKELVEMALLYALLTESIKVGHMTFLPAVNPDVVRMQLDELPELTTSNKLEFLLDEVDDWMDLTPAQQVLATKLLMAEEDVTPEYEILTAYDEDYVDVDIDTAEYTICNVH